MIKSIVSLVLLTVSAGLHLKHSWDAFNYKKNPSSQKMMTELGISDGAMPVMGVLSLIIAVLLVIPKTFFWANVLNAITIILIMALAIRADNLKMVWMEIPFLILPLVMIWLRYPFKN